MFIERYEAGLPWTAGIQTYATGVNGTHHFFFRVHESTEFSNAREAALAVLKASEHFPSWRIVEIEGGPTGIDRVRVFGGKRNI